jgi:hypothetical protein
MKIYFTSSITGLKKFRENCEFISEILHNQGHILCEDFLKISKEEDLKQCKEPDSLHKYITKKIKSSDVFIGDMSYRSGPVSYQLTYALENEKPTLYLYDEDKGQKPHAVFLGNPSKYLTVKGYNITNVEEVINDFLKSSSKLMLKRFNFLIDGELDEYLGIQAVKNRISKGEFIRNLIEQHREKTE